MNYLLALLTLVCSVFGLRYDVNEILRCHIEYTNPNDLRFCVIAKHYEQLWLSYEFPDEDSNGDPY